MLPYEWMEPFSDSGNGNSGEPVYAVAISPDLQWAATGGGDDRGLLWKPRQEDEPLQLTGNRSLYGPC